MTTLTTEEIVDMARQAGFEDFDRWCEHYPQETQRWCQRMEAFAKLVADVATAKEREACAKVCDELSKKHSWEGCYANECAEEIRARGNNT
jgi:hypothetical protein